jgi:hypothetical protein
MNKWFDGIRIYHLLIDRFNGGWQVPPASKNVFCGGNLQGVIGKLDYIKGLGFNALCFRLSSSRPTITAIIR